MKTNDIASDFYSYVAFLSMVLHMYVAQNIFMADCKLSLLAR